MNRSEQPQPAQPPALPTRAELIEGLQIIEAYPSESAFVEAQHDILFVPGASPEEMGAEHRQRLEALGWRWKDYTWEHYT